jgi:hypothetical protein
MRQKSYCSPAQLHFMNTVLEKRRPPRRFDWRSVSRLTAAGCVTFREVKFFNGEVGGEYVVLPEGIEQLRLAGYRA